jgi:pimeloyl-ACP methyl ester carboxylesterase
VAAKWCITWRATAKPGGKNGDHQRSAAANGKDRKAHYDGIVAFSQTGFTEDLKEITVPVLVMHGDDDQIVPYADSAPLSAKLLKNSTLKPTRAFHMACPRLRPIRLTQTYSPS